MKRRKRVALDCDGLLCAFLPEAQRIFASLFGYPMPELKSWDIAAVCPEGHSFDFWLACAQDRMHTSMRPYKDALRGVARLREAADVYIVTAPLELDRHWMPDRLTWLKHNFDIPSRLVQFQAEKHTFAGDMLVDDCPTHVENWAREHEIGIPVLWSMSYSESYEPPADLRHRIVRTNDWATVLRLAGG